MFLLTIIIILSTLNHIDTQLFLFLNGIHSPFFDLIFQWITERYSWIPFYIILTILIFIKFQWRGFILAPFIALVILFSDQFSVLLFKDVFMRLRPCHNPEIADMVHTINEACGGKYGFVSSHASNTFALAIFIGFIFKKHVAWMLYFMLCWATIVTYSRIYVGVHYPGDVLGGAILGGLIGFLMWKTLVYFNNYFNLKLKI